MCVVVMDVHFECTPAHACIGMSMRPLCPSESRLPWSNAAPSLVLHGLPPSSGATLESGMLSLCATNICAPELHVLGGDSSSVYGNMSSSISACFQSCWRPPTPAFVAVFMVIAACNCIFLLLVFPYSSASIAIVGSRIHCFASYSFVMLAACRCACSTVRSEGCAQTTDGPHISFFPMQL